MSWSSRTPKGWLGNGTIEATGSSWTTLLPFESRSTCEVKSSSTDGRLMFTFFLTIADHLIRKAGEGGRNFAPFVISEDAYADGRRFCG